jgi:hypothetical protein
MDIVGHVSRQMLARYSHIRMEAKRKALEAIVNKPAPAPQAPQPTEDQKAGPRPAIPNSSCTSLNSPFGHIRSAGTLPPEVAANTPNSSASASATG